MTAALAPFKCATSAGSQAEPTPLPYLQDPDYSSFDVALEVAITPSGGAEPTVVSRSNYRHMYWTPTQQLVHHAVTGCDMCVPLAYPSILLRPPVPRPLGLLARASLLLQLLQLPPPCRVCALPLTHALALRTHLLAHRRAGDLLASGTISGADESAYGSMLELCWQGTKDVGPLCDGTTRKFLKDGDTVIMQGKCTHPSGYTVGFGECVGQVLPAGSSPPPPVPPPPSAALRDVTLLSYWRSSCSWRVRVALAFYGVPYTYTSINLLAGEQSKVSSMGQVPRLDWTDGEGTRHSLTQSIAIIQLLDDVYGAAGGSPSMLPLDPIGRAKAREIAEIVNAGTQPLQNLGHIKEMSAAGADGRAIGGVNIAKGLATLEAKVATNRDPRYAVGSHVSIADACIVPQLYNARRFDVDLAPYPRLCAIEKHVSTLACFKAASPDVQPDAVTQAS